MIHELIVQLGRSQFSVQLGAPDVPSHLEIAEQVRKVLKNNKVVDKDYADYFGWPSDRILLRKGDAAIVDYHLVHRGGL